VSEPQNGCSINPESALQQNPRLLQNISGPTHRQMPAKLSPSRHLRIGRSRTGLGVFARVPIRKGQFIVRYSGRKISTEMADDLDTRYLFEINARWTIDGATRRNTARYINHSCRPNAEVYFVGHVIKIRAGTSSPATRSRITTVAIMSKLSSSPPDADVSRARGRKLSNAPRAGRDGSAKR
jgi:hypothetical protein